MLATVTLKVHQEATTEEQSGCDSCLRLPEDVPGELWVTDCMIVIAKLSIQSRIEVTKLP